MANVTKLQKELQKWLDEGGGWKKGDAFLATPERCAELKWKWGPDYPLTMSIDGSPLFVAINYGEPSWAIYEELKRIAKRNGFYVEMGYPWTVHFQEL